MQGCAFWDLHDGRLVTTFRGQIPQKPPKGADLIPFNASSRR